VAGALATVTRRNPVVAVVCLVGTFCAVAGLYATLHAHFLAARHQHAQVVEVQPEIRERIDCHPRLDHAIGIGRNQSLLAVQQLEKATLHPLKVVRLKKEPLVPVNLHSFP
jgi:hypothetical protein